jgi:hypothetical protein
VLSQGVVDFADCAIWVEFKIFDDSDDYSYRESLSGSDQWEGNTGRLALSGGS